MRISIPCGSCGCDAFEGTCKKDGKEIHISVCACDDGSGYFNIRTIKDPNGEIPEEDWLTFKSKEEAEVILNSCFNTITEIHYCP